VNYEGLRLWRTGRARLEARGYRERKSGEGFVATETGFSERRQRERERQKG
jgi:hypothetical protein